MSKMDIFKSGARLLASLGVGAVVGNAINHTSPDNMKLVSKVIVKIGALVVSSALGDLAVDYVDKTIEEAAKSISEAVEEMKENDGETVVE